MTAEDYRLLVDEWAKTLRVQDWVIEIEVVTEYTTFLAQVDSQSNYKQSVMKIVKPENIPASIMGNKDPEVSIVHELLHLQAGHLNCLVAKNKYRRYHSDLERLVELTAIALVAQKREIERVRKMALEGLLP